MRRMLVFLVPLLAACGEPLGSCVGSDGLVDVCKQDWTEAECREWDEQDVDLATWTFHGESCEELGFAVTCPDGTRVGSASEC